jgi:hypothetical protein
MKALLALLLMFSAAPAMAYDLDLGLAELDKVDMEYYKIVNNRNDYTQFPDAQGAAPGQEHWVDGAAILWDINLLRWSDVASLYWHNRVHMEDTNAQVRQVGWEWEAGIDIKSKVDFFWYHHSQHALDMAVPGERYPLQNMYGVRVNLYTRDK